MGSAKRDNYGVPALLGQGKKDVIPIKATEDGKLLVHMSGTGAYEYKLIKTLALDLGTIRDREDVVVDFDCLVIGNIQGTITLTVDSHNMTINKCLSMDLTAESVQVSNTQQQGSFCELWFFKKEVI